MKLIQIFAFALITAAMALGQTASQSPQPGTKSSSVAKPATAPSAQVKPAPSAKNPVTAAKKPVTTAKKPAAAKKPTSSTASAHAAPATKPATKAVAAHTTSATSAKPASAHPGKPVVATGTLTGKRAAITSQVKKPAPAAMVHPAAKPTVSPVATKKATAKITTKAPKAVAGSKSNAKVKPTVAPVRQNSSAAKVDPKAEPKPATPAKLLGAAGRRDPFVSPIRNASAVTPQSCSSGKRCLAIPELVLQGTVRDVTGKMMAVVSTSNRRTYTLRENDQVYNGSVEKITSDSIIFREFVRDAVGREAAKEVVKKMGPTS